MVVGLPADGRCSNREKKRSPNSRLEITRRVLNCRRISAIDREGRTIWIVDAHRDNGKRFVVRSDEMLSAFLELERITHDLALSGLLGDDS
jgi:hypothetical protein